MLVVTIENEKTLRLDDASVIQCNMIIPSPDGSECAVFFYEDDSPFIFRAMPNGTFVHYGSLDPVVTHSDLIRLRPKIFEKKTISVNDVLEAYDRIASKNVDHSAILLLESLSEVLGLSSGDALPMAAMEQQGTFRENWNGVVSSVAKK